MESNGAPFLAYVYKPLMDFPIEESPLDFNFGRINGKENEMNKSSKKLNRKHHIEEEIYVMEKEIPDVMGQKEFLNTLSNILRLARL